MKILALLLASAFPAAAQTPAAGYEAASIKLSRPADPRRRSLEFLPGGRFRATAVPLFQVLATAYDVPWQSIEVLTSRIRGIPDWMFSELYDIEATAERPDGRPSPVKARNDRIRRMLQAVMADRLKLRVRRATVEQPGYALVASPSGVKLSRSKVKVEECAESAPFAAISASAPGCHQIQGGTGRGMHAAAADMADAARFLSNWSDRPIVDATGLTGLYALDTGGWSSTGDDPARPPLVELLSRLGLGLASRKVAVETIEIEHVERPSEN